MAAIDMTKIYANKDYKGKWVAIINHETKPKVVAYGKSLGETMDEANKKGYELPLMTHIPKKVLPFVGESQLIK